MPRAKYYNTTVQHLGPQSKVCKHMAEIRYIWNAAENIVLLYHSQSNEQSNAALARLKNRW